MGIAQKIVLLSLLSLVFPTEFTAGQVTSQHPYQPIENTPLACGLLASSSEQVNSRVWLPDLATTKLFTLIEPATTNKSTPSKATHPPSEQSHVPYLNARISHSEFSYSFPVSSGKKFIRLHFYPTDTYPGFEHYPAFFSVRTGNFTLLNNFTGILRINDEESFVYVKEFLVSVGEDEKNLTVTFTPSSVIPNSYAFVNGIELVSMPNNLYYPTESLYLVDTPGTPFPITNGTVLETMYRINVGGAPVAPEDDTGMFRRWDSDQPYADNPFAIGATPVDNTNAIPLKFTNNAKNYTAPAVVYQTAQAMGPNGTINERNNLTWRFTVDSGFTYLVRLHFCQLVPNYSDPSDMVFSIYVGTFLVENTFEVNGGVGVPLYRDYPVVFGNLEGAPETAKINLSIQLHPAVEYTKYADAMLNGVEIFKASNYDGDLSGIHFYSPRSIPNSSSGHNSVHPFPVTKYVIIGGVGSGLVVLCFLMVVYIFRFRKLKSPTNSKQNSLPSSGACRCFPLSEIKAATNNFHQEFIVDQADVESVDMESPFRYGGSSTADDNEDLFRISSGIVVDSRLDGFASGTNTSNETNTSSEERSLLSVPSSEVLKSGAVFSEILHPNGR